MRIKGILTILPDSSKLFLSVAIWLFMIIMSFMVGGLLVFVFTGLNIFSQPELLNNLSQPHTLFSLQLMQLVSSVLTFIFSALLAVFLFEKSIRNFFGTTPMPSVLVMLLTVILTFSLAPLIDFLVDINNAIALPDSLSGVEKWMQQSEIRNTKITDAFLQMNTVWQLLFNLLLIALIPALGEELFFRGLLQQLLIKTIGNYHIAIFCTAAIFSAIHFQFFGFLPRMLLGIVLGYVFVWSKSIWVPVLLHFVNNGSMVLLTYLSHQNKTELDFANENIPNNFWLISTSLILSIGLIYVIKFKSKHKDDVLEK